MPSSQKIRIDPKAKISIQSMQSPGDSDLYQELKELFLQTSDEFLQAIKTNQTSAEIIHHNAHAWKSSAAALGALILADLCRQLEVADTSEFESLISEIEIEYIEVRNELLK